jgi:hypothetical protein
LFEDQDITAEAPAHIARRSVIRSVQISAVFPHLTVLENVGVALQRKLGSSFQFWHSDRSLDALNDRALQLLGQVDLEKYAQLTAVELSYGTQACAKDRHHAGDGTQTDAARRADPGHGAGGCRPHSPVDKYKLLAFVLSTAIAGLAGSLKTLVLGFATLSDAHWSLSGEVVLMTLLGGMGTFAGPVIGAFTIIGLQDYLADRVGSWVTVIIGAIFVVCVLAFRKGFVGELIAWQQRRGKPAG